MVIDQVKCQKVDCKRKGYWVELTDAGEKLFCIRTRHNGENHCQKFTLDEIEKELAGFEGSFAITRIFM